MVNPVSNPHVTFQITRSTNTSGVQELRTLVIGQMDTVSGSVSPGQLHTGIPHDDEIAINNMFGEGSHIAWMLRKYRKQNSYTVVDAIALEDDALATKATASIVWAGAATSYGSLWVTVASGDHRYKIDVEVNDTPTNILTKLTSAITADKWLPFTDSDNGTTTSSFEANNAGAHANAWPIIIEGRVPGVSYTLNGWSGGATDPSLTALFDLFHSIRYQRIVWPEAYDVTALRAIMDTRKNVDNQVMDGTGITYYNGAFAAAKTMSLSLNSSEIILLTNEPNDYDDWKGPHIPEAPDLISAWTAAMFDLREEDGVPISNVVSDNEPLDQFGGLHTIVKPFFNTPYAGMRQPRSGTGYSHAEIKELMESGVTVLGANHGFTGVVLGQVYTTWQKDPAGNDDTTWSVYNNRLTHGRIREYLHNNFRARFSQHRLSLGDAIEGYAIATEGNIRSFMLLLYDELSEISVAIRSLEARRFFDDNLDITLEPNKRRATINSIVPINSQLADIDGAIQYTLVPVSFALQTAA